MARMAAGKGWSRDELLVAFRLYCRTPFGKLHQHNPEIIELARLIGRTPSAVGMKACNFASLDPAQQTRGIRALPNLSNADRALWSEFEQNSEAIAAEAEAAYERISGVAVPVEVEEIEIPEGPTEVERMVRARRVQGFFRSTVLNSYDYRCALTGITVVQLLNASHIIPWHADPQRRADPRNGLCLNVLHDRAFDRGLISFDEDWRLVLSARLRASNPTPMHRSALLDFEGQPLQPPDRFKPDPVAMAYHREHVFDGRVG